MAISAPPTVGMALSSWMALCRGGQIRHTHAMRWTLVLCAGTALSAWMVGCGSAGGATEEGIIPVSGGEGGEGGESGASGASGNAGGGGLAGKGGSAGSTGGKGGGAGASGASGAAGKAGSSGSSGSSGGGAAGSGGASGASGAGGSSGAAGGKVCPPPPTCDAALPALGAKKDWNHITSNAIVLAGSPNHRGRDLFVNPGAPQWIIGKFAYGLTDKDLKGEDVDIYLLRGCQGPWEKLGSAQTTNDGDHATVEGVDDSGGRVYFEIPAAKALGPGRHRVLLVVAGDHTTTDVFFEVVPEKTPIFVSDVDGTLTTSETEEYGALLTGVTPNANDGAAAVLNMLAQKGYRPMYVTARPEFLVERTREFVAQRGFPIGLVHTTLGLTGALGGSASTYKTDELAMLAGKGLVPAWAFGNTNTDADAYENGKIQPLKNRVFYQYTDSAHGGRRIESYNELLAEVTALPAVCP